MCVALWPEPGTPAHEAAECFLFQRWADNLVRCCVWWQAPYLRYGMTVRHVIDENSPLFNHTAQSLYDGDASFSLTISGTDRTSMQPVFDMQVSGGVFIMSGNEMMGRAADCMDSVWSPLCRVVLCRSTTCLTRKLCGELTSRMSSLWTLTATRPLIITDLIRSGTFRCAETAIVNFAVILLQLFAFGCLDVGEVLQPFLCLAVFLFACPGEQGSTLASQGATADISKVSSSLPPQAPGEPGSEPRSSAPAGQPASLAHLIASVSRAAACTFRSVVGQQSAGEACREVEEEEKEQ